MINKEFRQIWGQLRKSCIGFALVALLQIAVDIPKIGLSIGTQIPAGPQGATSLFCRRGILVGSRDFGFRFPPKRPAAPQADKLETRETGGKGSSGSK